MKTKIAGTTEDLPDTFSSLDPSDFQRNWDELEVPELRAKEEGKERKGAGAPWLLGSRDGSSVMALGSGGVRMGTSLSQPGLLGSGRLATALSRFFGSSSTFMGGFFASKLGSVLVLSVMALWGVAMLVAALRLTAGSPEAPAPAVVQFPESLGSDIVIDAPKDVSLGYLVSANQGELAWDKQPEPEKEAPAQEQKVEPPPVPQPEPAQEPAKARVPEVGKLWDDALRKGGLDGGFGKKPTEGVGWGSAGGLKDSLGALKLTKTFAGAGLPKPVQLGQTAAMKRSLQALRAGHRSFQTASSRRAIGQLKFAKNASMSARAAQMDSQAKQFSTDAFEQGRSIGGSLQGIDTGSGIVVPPGDGAPGLSEEIPDVPPSQNVTPYQSNVDNARNDDNDSGALKMLGMLLLLMGMMMMMMGMKLMSNPLTASMGAMLVAMGLALIVMGMAMLAMSSNKANQARDQGKQIQQQYGQDDQGDVIDQCAGQAEADGTKADQCRTGASDAAGRKAGSDIVHEAVTQESASTYTLGGGAGAGGGTRSDDAGLR